MSKHPLKAALLLGTILALGAAFHTQAAPAAPKAAVQATSFSLANAFGDHMVLQRGRPIRFAGTATPGSPVYAKFRGRRADATADADGLWSVEFPAEEAGGPFTASFLQGLGGAIGGIELKDLWIGEVWLCSGQSNMEYPVSWGDNPFFKLPDGERVAAEAKDPLLRLMRVDMHSTCPDGPCVNLPGRPRWSAATDPEAVRKFSAVGYFFGRELRRSLPRDVPVGLVCAAWGGTRIEPWIPLDALRDARMKDDVTALEIARAPEQFKAEVAKLKAETKARLKTWVAEKFLKSDPEASARALASWGAADLPPDGWKVAPHGRMDGLAKPGTAWYRFAFDLPAEHAGKELVFHAGYVNDCDQTFLDGELIGETGVDGENYWAAARNYRVKPLKAGRHVVAIRAFDHYGAGGIASDVHLREPNGRIVKDFSDGDWCERVEFRYDVAKNGPRPTVFSSEKQTRFSAQTPSTLYNSMIHPVAQMNIGGVIWYQGCANAGEPAKYAKSQRTLVEAWRKAFRHPELPFISTQLSAFKEQRPNDRLADDFWKNLGADEALGYAPMRAVQLEMLDYPYAGVACTIDLGDHSDIHPCRKEPVGQRLAHEALRIAYGDATRLPGPRAAKVTRLPGGRLAVSFRDAGAGIEARGGAIGPHLVAVGDKAGNWTWADAELAADGRLVVSSPECAKAVAVRYAWSAFPPNPPLFRKGDGLPVFPFSVKLAEDEADGLFSVSRTFSSHMVVPRDVAVTVWGRGEAGKAVTVSFAGQTATGKVAADGTWQVALEPLAASAEGRTMTIASGDGKIELEDCLVGDVWLCGGQSNMEYRFNMGEYDWEKEKAESAKYPAIRWMKIERETSETPRPYVFKYSWGGEASWTRAAEAFDRLTCAGYYFAKAINRELGVPVGFVDAAWNGSRIEPFIPQFGPDGALAAAQQKRGASFNAMMAPLARFAFRGAIWYQGCSNSSDGLAYADKQKEMVEGWRRVFGAKLPFYYVQLCSLGKPDQPVGAGFAAIREGQRQFLKRTDNVGMAVSIDVGNPTDVHAKAKRLVGERLARLALAGTYGKSIVPAGPNCTGMTVEGAKVRLAFENVGGGLVTASKDWQNNDDPTLTPGAPLKGFWLAGAADAKGKRKWTPAEAAIDGDTVVVSAKDVPAPEAVAYAYEANPMGRCNLYNRELLPASPFILEIEP